MSAEPILGRTIAGKYRLLERIGVGGMSEVYRAEQIPGGQVVAVKLLLPHKLEDPSFVARMFQEAHSGFRIRHPAVVEVHDAGQSDLGPFMVMDYLIGESAGRKLYQHGRLSPAAAIATMVPILEALQAVHDAGVVHRDIKPGNIFYSVEGPGEVRVKLLDFGVAKVLWPSGAAPRTSTGVVMGTPDYLSPEQASGELALDGRSDVFSSGTVLFELLTATRPFHAPTAVATAYKVAHQRTPTLRERGGPSDATLQAIIERALAKRPDERYASARELARELAGLVSEPDRARALTELIRPEQYSVRDRGGSGERPITPPRTPVPTSSAGGWPTPGSGSRGQADAAPSDAKQVRGVVLRAVDEYVKQAFGAAVRDRARAALPKEVATELEYASLPAIVLYDVGVLNRFTDAITREAAMGNVGWGRAAGLHAASTELAAILKHAVRPAEVPIVLRRLMPVLARVFSFGAWELSDDKLCTLRITDMEPVNAPTRLWLIGVLEGALAAAGARARVTIARGDMPYASQIVVDVVPS